MLTEIFEISFEILFQIAKHWEQLKFLSEENG